MHTAYRIYNSLCMLHLPISIILLLSGFSGSFRYLDIQASSSSRNNYYHYNYDLNVGMPTVDDNTTEFNSHHILNFLHVKEEVSTLSAGYFIASISACLYAAVYLSLYNADTPSFLSLPYFYHGEKIGDLEPEGELSLESTKRSNLTMLSEMIYWSFVPAYSYTAIASNTLHLGTIDFLYLRLLVHLFCIYIICSQNNKANSSANRVDIVGSIAFIVLIGETFLVIAMTGTQIYLIMAYFHRFLDFLLVLGHRWDINPSWEVILNCRLFFMAIGGFLLHMDLLLTALQ